MNIFCLFYGTVFCAFGLGISLSQLVGDKLVSGFFFLIIGFLLLTFSVILKEVSIPPNPEGMGI